MKKIILIIGIIIVLLIAGFFAFNSYIYYQKQRPGSQSFEPYRGTLSGEYVCIPKKEADEMVEGDCKFGIKTEAGEYYAIDFMLMSQEGKELNLGDQISANGLITPIERLSSDFWKAYPVEGIFSVTDSVEVIE